MKTYIIVPTSIPEETMDLLVDECIQTSKETLRKSLDGSKAVLKFSGIPTPAAVTALGDIPHYSHKSILEILRGPEWTDPDREI